MKTALFYLSAALVGIALGLLWGYLILNMSETVELRPVPPARPTSQGAMP